MPLALSLAVGAVVQFLIPTPEGITSQAWSLLALFVTTIAGMPPLHLPRHVCLHAQLANCQCLRVGKDSILSLRCLALCSPCL